MRQGVRLALMFHSSGSSFESDSVKPSMAISVHVRVDELRRQREDRNHSHHAY